MHALSTVPSYLWSHLVWELSVVVVSPRVGSIAGPMVEGLLPFHSYGRMHLELSHWFPTVPTGWQGAIYDYVTRIS